MREIELKFQVPPRRRAALARSVTGRRMHLQATYLDTADRALAAAGLALRLRREGRRWVQTLKGDEVADGMTRLEHNVPLPGLAGVLPAIDLAVHTATPLGRRLREALAKASDPSLVVQYRTDIWRRTRELRTAQGRVELAWDEGFIEAGAHRLPVCELEIELLSGSPAAVITSARRWVRGLGLWLDTRSKAERGDRLSRADESLVPSRPGGVARPEEGMSLADARRWALRGCFRQIGANASEVAGGSREIEPVHQLRVGLRRLRSLQRFLAEPGAAPPAWQPGASDLSRRLGVARDRDAIATAVLPRLQAALAQAGLAKGEGLCAMLQPTSNRHEGETPAEVVRSEAAQTLLLDLLEAMTQGADATAAPQQSLRSLTRRRLARWDRRVQTDIQRFALLDEHQRHALRKRIKRLRYAAEWAAPLYARRGVKPYVAALCEAQACLGEISDMSLAVAAFRKQPGAEPHALFALGWLSSQVDCLLAAAPARLGALARAPRFWKKKP